MRSNATVAAAVSSMTASERVERRIDAHIVDLDHPHGGDHQHAGERGERDASHERATEEDHDRRAPRAWTIADRRVRAPDAHVHRGPGDRAGRGHPAEQRRGEVGEALAEQLASGVVPSGVAHAVGDLGREQTLEIGQRAPTANAAETDHRRADRRERGSEGVGRRPGQRADARSTSSGDAGETVATTTASSEAGNARCKRTAPTMIDRDRGRAARRPCHRARNASTDRPKGDRRRVFAVGLRHTERGRNLLQEDDDRDPDREALHDGPRHVSEEAADAANTATTRITPAMTPTTNTASAP